MTIASNLGFPRIGRRRELKIAMEQFWAGDISEAGLLAQASTLRLRHWRLQSGAGISHIPAGDHSLYDHVLDTACMLGAIPDGYGWAGGPVSLPTYYALARGSRGTDVERNAGVEPGLPALEMTKWFDTNYHYLVPQLAAGQRFLLTGNRPLEQFREAALVPLRTRPMLLGPVTFLLLAKTADRSDALELMGDLLPVYAQILAELADAGAAWVQVDEPALALNLDGKSRAALIHAYGTLSRGRTPNILLTSYFGALGGNLTTAAELPVAGLHIDLVRGAAQLDDVLAILPKERWLSLGLVDGRNVWRTDLRAALSIAQKAASVRGTRRLMVAPSSSLAHVPIDLAQEENLDPEVKGWLAFATQKLDEVVTLAKGLDEGEAAVSMQLAASDAAVRARGESPRVHRAAVAEHLGMVGPDETRRKTPYMQRRSVQQAKLSLPVFPTTTIGSFPQTPEIRHARASLSRRLIGQSEYEAVVEKWIDDAVCLQEQLGLDVLVHGEFERNDMVKYFGEQLEGYAFTQHGWVQSYGSRCVAPPVIWGDVSRRQPMTVRWSAYAQSRTERPMKGMLTGPVTMMQWSFVRDDIPRETVCRQIALAIRDEVLDLETAGIRIIQVDEPAFREGLPLNRAEWAEYLAWAVACFRLSTSSVADETSIHTHMCYSEFNDIMPAIAAMDADAISIETTRSRMELLEAFVSAKVESAGYPAEIGPGIWDVHSPRVPEVAEMVQLLRLARNRLEDWQIWVNPDCGLKTRKWEEVRPALANLVAAARQLREETTA